MRLEKIAIEIGNVRRRAAIQRAEVPDNDTPEGVLGRTDAAITIVGGRFIAKFKRLLMGATAFFLVVIAPPCLHDGNKKDSSINVAVFADAEKQDAVEDVLDSFIEFVAFKQIFAIVVLEQVSAKFNDRED